MAQEIRSFQVLTPTGTLAASPLVTDLSFPPRTVQQVEITVPPGPSGLVGFALGLAGQPIIPLNAGEWIVTDDERISWPLVDYPNSGAWQLTTYNLGDYDHTIYVRFLLAVIDTSGSSGAQPIPAAALGG